MSRDWLSRIAPDTRINVLAVPGTHDAASVSGASSMPMTITQRIGITDQLDAGVRVLDMRVAHCATSTSGGWIRTKTVTPEDIYMCHGPIVFSTRLSQALDSIKQWLSTNDSEFVVLIFQQQGTKPQNATERSRVVGLIKTAITNTFSREWIFGPGDCGTDWPNVGQLRKKVMIFSRLDEPMANTFDLSAWNTASLKDMVSAQFDMTGTNLKVAIQDRFTQVTNTDLTDHLNKGCIFNNIDQINQAKILLFEKMHSQHNGRRTLKINHLSHSLKSPTYPQPYMLGTDINARLKASIGNKSKRYRGFVMIDDAEESVCKSIIDSNVVFQTDSR